ncbi:MAG: hypothetical protein ACR2LU_01720 [Luteitalea sp.]
MNSLPALCAIGVAWLAGVGVVGWAWPRQATLTAWSGIGLAGLLGPFAVVVLLLAAAHAGLGQTSTCAVVSIGAVAIGVTGIVRGRRASGQVAPPGGRRARITLALVVAATLAATLPLASRTHLGWDGTVVWYHRARILAGSGGRVTAAAMQDRTRSWTAPDYPLHVPLAMAWVRLWLSDEDERAVKVVPATWLIALVCLTAAAVLERGGGGRSAAMGAGAAVLLLASAPRMLVGEGSLTSGFADGPAAGLLAALVWVAWRSDWGEDRRWQMLLAMLAAALVWTKQEGLVAVLGVALACGLPPGRRRQPMAFALPAVLVSVAWLVTAVSLGAPIGMAYEWPGLAGALARVPLIASAYVRAMADLSVWGLLWPAGALSALMASTGSSWRGWLVVAIVVAGGAVAFTCSAWPDVGSHLAVTAPRQLVQAVPVSLVLTFGGVVSEMGD